MHDHFGNVQAERLRYDLGRAAFAVLRGRPDFGPPVDHMGGAGLRLHRRVRQVRHLVVGRHPPRGGCQRRVYVADALAYTPSAPGRPGLYLKMEPRSGEEELGAERLRLEWIGGRLPVPRVQSFIEDERYLYLLTSEVPGIDASDSTASVNQSRSAATWTWSKSNPAVPE